MALPAMSPARMRVVAEMRGLKVFSNPQVGNCASCHYQGAGLNGSSALFTDFSYEAISVPRNMAIPANADPEYHDLGACARRPAALAMRITARETSTDSALVCFWFRMAKVSDATATTSRADSTTCVCARGVPASLTN